MECPTLTSLHSAVQTCASEMKRLTLVVLDPDQGNPYGLTLSDGVCDLRVLIQPNSLFVDIVRIGDSIDLPNLHVRSMMLILTFKLGSITLSVYYTPNTRLTTTLCNLAQTQYNLSCATIKSQKFYFTGGVEHPVRKKNAANMKLCDFQCHADRMYYLISHRLAESIF